MSEKLDGVRAFWDGQQLISRSGKVFQAPDWFTQKFPSFELDGELYLARNSFEKTVSIVNKKTAHKGWKQIVYKIFEVPHAQGVLTDRLAQAYPFEHKYLKIIPQVLCKGKRDVKTFLQTITDLKGEGAVLRDAQALYHTGRTNRDLKVKPYHDDECIVEGYKAGAGKFRGLMGALKCRMKNKQLILIGSGFNRNEREQPPVIGSAVTFKYYGYTRNGIPKFPIYLRVRKR